jgi:hypothetical protein
MTDIRQRPGLSDEYEGFDHPTYLWKGDGRSRVGIGFDCVADGSCYLTYRAEDFVEQLGLDRNQIEWLIAIGLPAVLNDMNPGKETG